MPNGYIIEIFKWAFILMNIMGFSFRILNVISPYQLIVTFFNMDVFSFKRFHKGLKFE